MQRAVVSIWSLLAASRSGNTAEQWQAAEQASAEICEHCARVFRMTLTLRDGVLMLDDRKVESGADSFAATHELLLFLRDAGIGSVQFSSDVSHATLIDWARWIIAGAEECFAGDGIVTTKATEHDCDDAAAIRALQRGDVAPEAPDSRLRSVFLVHRLVDRMAPTDGVAAPVAKLIMQAIVDRLLQLPNGLDPLMLLQQADGVLARGTRVAVFAVLLGRIVGWRDEQLADLGAAGLLHDIGVVLDAEQPDKAAFRWLLERGDDDFWLRSALIARGWRETGRRDDPAGPMASIALVRMATHLADDGIAGLSAEACPGVPGEMFEVAAAGLAPA